MSIDQKVINLKLAMKKNRSKDIVKYKFQEYLKEYDQLSDPSITRKINHRDLFYDYCRYMCKSEDGKRK